ncbi:MAG: alpha-L-glutamate ligase-like protein [Pirellulales bacterium]|nr:alpha-L-glutamate ligase-like protein [Pirellulales bacterium]
MARSRWRLWAWTSEMRQSGVLGMNERNASYVLPWNSREYFPHVDDKLLTKNICARVGIPIPRTFAVVERQGDIHRIANRIGNYLRFVVKPTRGSAGRGIVVIAGRSEDGWITSSGDKISITDLQYHMSVILAGLYSLSGQLDRVIIEQRILLHSIFERVAVGGTPDIRVILYRGVPVMAMVRLPTKASRGRGNLHQGALGAGVHLQTGETFGGVCRNHATDVHPDTQQPIAGLRIPQWNELLRYAMLLSDNLKLGFLGIDFALDAYHGPVVLEANGRPGLSIQIANRTGLRHRLAKINSMLHIPSLLDERMAMIPGLTEC